MTFDDQQPSNPIKAAIDAYAGQVLTVAQLKSFPPPTWLINGYLMQSSQAVIWGSPAAGKSFIALDWALSVATGRRWFNNKVVQGNALYVLGEGALGAIAQRIEAWEANKGMKLDDEQNFLVVRKPVRMLEDYADVIINDLVARQQGATGMPTRLIIIDTLARAVVGHNENDSAEIGKLIAVADEIKDQTKATILFVHHASTGGRMRGSTALGGGLDTEIEMIYDDHDKSTRTLHCRKQKDAAYFEDQPLTFKEVANSVVPIPVDNREF